MDLTVFFIKIENYRKFTKYAHPSISAFLFYTAAAAELRSLTKSKQLTVYSTLSRF